MCVIKIVIFTLLHRRTGGAGNQCCYGRNGRLLVGPPGGGTVDRVSPEISELDHFVHDVLPYLWCCKGLFSNCDKYYEHRPSDDGSCFDPPPPGENYCTAHI